MDPVPATLGGSTAGRTLWSKRKDGVLLECVVVDESASGARVLLRENGVCVRSVGFHNLLLAYAEAAALDWEYRRDGWDDAPPGQAEERP